MNILILNWRDIKNPKSGGAEIATYEHAKAWVKAGNSVYWFSSKFNHGKKEEILDGIRIIRKGNPYTIYLIAPFFYFFSKIKFNIVIDEIHGLPFLTPLYVKTGRVAFIHEIAGIIWDYIYPFPLNIICKKAELLLLNFYKQTPFITVSESSRKDLIDNGMPEENIYVILNGINIKRINTFPQKEKHLTLIFVSRIVKMKGIEDVIKAFSYICKKNNKAKLWIVGEGQKEYVDHLKAFISSNKITESITFFGKVTEEKKVDLMRRAHILLHASIKEGWGLVVSEAASQATPAIVYNVPGLRDSVKHLKTGIILFKNTPEEMAKSISFLINDKKIYAGFQNACLIATREMRWEIATKKSMQLLYEISKN